MKKNLCKFLVILALIFCAFFCSNNYVKTQASASADMPVSVQSTTPNSDESLDEDTPIEGEDGESETIAQLRARIDQEIQVGYEIKASTNLTDARLYSALLKIVKERILEKYNYYYSDLDTLYSKTFESTVLAIDTIEIDNGWDIESLNGFELFYFPYLKSLTIVGNNLGELNDNLFERMTVLEYLNLSCNNIKKINFKFAPYLKTINLSSNSLTNVDLTYLINPNLDINLANNQFSSIKNISLPTRVESIKLNILANNITDLTDEYFDYSKLTLNVGVQGLVGTTTKTIDTSTSINFYKSNLNGVYVKILKKGIGETLIKEIKDTDIVDNSLSQKFSVGEYYVVYYNADGTEAYRANDGVTGYFKTCELKVIPTVCSAKFEFKGKIYDNFPNKVTGKVKVMLSCEEGGEIYYKFGNNDWIKGNEIMCDKGGNYGITTKVVIDGIESEEKSFLVKTSLNTVIPDILMLVLILIFTLALFLIVVPFVSKKWFRK